jgi:hypothetical protein
MQVIGRIIIIGHNRETAIGHIKIIGHHNNTTKTSPWQELNQEVVDKEWGAITELMQGEQEGREEESGVMAEALAVARVEEPFHHSNKHRLLHHNQPM